MPDTSVLPQTELLAEIESRSGQKVSACYQCFKCTAGCPLAFAMDFGPNQVMRLAQLGLRDELLAANTSWVCASCQACTTRCPNEIDIARLMDTLRQMSREAGSADERIVKFHEALLGSVRKHGRLFELGLAMRYKLATGDLLGDVGLGMGLFRRGRLNLLPENIKSRDEVRKMFDAKDEG